jgi:hypothetical protein
VSTEGHTKATAGRTADSAVGVALLACTLAAVLDALEKAVADAGRAAVELGADARGLVRVRGVDALAGVRLLTGELNKKSGTLERERVQAQVVRV